MHFHLDLMYFYFFGMGMGGGFGIFWVDIIWGLFCIPSRILLCKRRVFFHFDNASKLNARREHTSNHTTELQNVEESATKERQSERQKGKRRDMR